MTFDTRSIQNNVKTEKKKKKKQEGSLIHTHINNRHKIDDNKTAIQENQCLKRKNDIQISLGQNWFLFCVHDEKKVETENEEEMFISRVRPKHLWIDIYCLYCIKQFNNMFINIMFVYWVFIFLVINWKGLHLSLYFQPTWQQRQLQRAKHLARGKNGNQTKSTIHSVRTKGDQWQSDAIYTPHLSLNSKKSLDKIQWSFLSQLPNWNWKMEREYNCFYFSGRTLIHNGEIFVNCAIIFDKMLMYACKCPIDGRTDKTGKRKHSISHLFCLHFAHETYIVFNTLNINNFYFCLTIWNRMKQHQQQQHQKRSTEYIGNIYLWANRKKKANQTKWWKKRRTHEHTTTEHSIYIEVSKLWRCPIKRLASKCLFLSFRLLFWSLLWLLFFLLFSVV